MKQRSLKIAIIFIILTLATTVIFAQDDPPEIRNSYHVCDWGLIVIQFNQADQLFDVTITSPQNYLGIPGTTFTVEGTGKGLFEGNVVVEVLDNEGNILFSEPTLVATDEIGGEGDWSIDIDLGTLDSPTRVQVHAYSTEPSEGNIIAQDFIWLNVNSEFGLPFVDITRPFGNSGVSTMPLLIKGTAGAIFENNLNVQVLDSIGGNILAETFATVQTDELAGRGAWSVEVDLDLDIGTSFVVYAFQPSIADGETITIDDTQFGVASPLAQPYDKILVLQAGDPITMTDDLCGETQAEFDNESIIPILVNDVNAMATLSMTPNVNVIVEAQKPSVCALPLRIRVTGDEDNNFSADLYQSTAEGDAICTRDLQPITAQFPLGRLASDIFTLTVNDVALE